MAQFVVQIPWDNISECSVNDTGIWADWLCPLGLFQYANTQDSDYLSKFAMTYAAFVLGCMTLRQSFQHQKLRDQRDKLLRDNNSGAELDETSGLFSVPVFFCPQWEDMKASEYTAFPEGATDLLLQTRDVLNDYKSNVDMPLTQLDVLHRSLRNHTLEFLQQTDGSSAVTDHEITKALKSHKVKYAGQANHPNGQMPSALTAEAVWEACCVLRGIKLQKQQLIPRFAMRFCQLVMRFTILHVRKVIKHCCHH